MGAPPEYPAVVLCHGARSCSFGLQYWPFHVLQQIIDGWVDAGLVSLTLPPPSRQGEFSSVTLLLSCPQVWLATHSPPPALLCCLGDVQGHPAAVVSHLMRDEGSSLTLVTSACHKPQEAHRRWRGLFSLAHAILW